MFKGTKTPAPEVLEQLPPGCVSGVIGQIQRTNVLVAWEQTIQNVALSQISDTVHMSYCPHTGPICLSGPVCLLGVLKTGSRLWTCLSLKTHLSSRCSEDLSVSLVFPGVDVPEPPLGEVLGADPLHAGLQVEQSCDGLFQTFFVLLIFTLLLQLLWKQKGAWL